MRKRGTMRCLMLTESIVTNPRSDLANSRRNVASLYRWLHRCA